MNINETSDREKGEGENKGRSDYSSFPFGELTVDQIARLMMEEIRLNGDKDFIDACRNQIATRKE
jgi:hypothetical protein